MADIGTKNVSEPDLTPRMKYIMVRMVPRVATAVTLGLCPRPWRGVVTAHTLLLAL